MLLQRAELVGRRIVAALITIAFFNWSGSHASDLTWKQEYLVPEGEIWIVSWTNPYSPGEIIPVYDLRIIEGKYQIIDPDLIYKNRDNYGVASLFAGSSSVEGQVKIYGGTRFQVANDIIQFDLVIINDIETHLGKENRIHQDQQGHL